MVLYTYIPVILEMGLILKAVNEYRVFFWGGTSSKGRKILKREGKERYWGKKWKWEAKTKNRPRPFKKEKKGKKNQRSN